MAASHAMLEEYLFIIVGYVLDCSCLVDEKNISIKAKNITGTHVYLIS